VQKNNNLHKTTTTSREINCRRRNLGIKLDKQSHGLWRSAGLFTPTFLGCFGAFWPANWVRLTRFLACDQGSLVGLCKQDYKFLSVAVTTCSTLVNIHTETHRQHLTSLYEKISQLS